MGRDSEAKPELYQQTLGSSRRRRQGAGPTPWSEAVPSQQPCCGQWDTGALSQPDPACGTCPRLVHSPSLAWRSYKKGKRTAFTGCSQRVIPRARTGGLGLPLVLASLGWAAQGSSHCSSWQEPWASRGFDCNRMSHSYTQLRCSEMLSHPSRSTLSSCRSWASLPASRREGREVPTSPFRTSAAI